MSGRVIGPYDGRRMIVDDRVTFGPDLKAGVGPAGQPLNPPPELQHVTQLSRIEAKLDEVLGMLRAGSK